MWYSRTVTNKKWCMTYRIALFVVTFNLISSVTWSKAVSPNPSCRVAKFLPSVI